MEGCVMFELISAVTMVAGLQAAPEQIKIAQILQRYEKVAMEPKALRIEFKRKENDPIDKNTIEYQGVFVLYRDKEVTSFVVETFREKQPDLIEKMGFVGTDFFEVRPMTKQIRIHRMDKIGRHRFEDTWIRSAFPLSNISNLKLDFQLKMVKNDENYTYIELSPNTPTVRACCTRSRVVFANKEMSFCPHGSLRWWDAELPNGGSLSFDIVKWQVNDTEDKMRFPIRQPELPAGWQLAEVKHPLFPINEKE